MKKSVLKSIAFGVGFCFLPVAEAQAMHDDWPFGRSLFREFDHPFFSQSSANFYTSSHVSEDDKNFVLSIDVPGMTKDDVHMNLENDGVLVIDAKKEIKDKKDCKDEKKVRHVSRSFYQRFKLPPNAAMDKIDAEVKNGVLMVTIPKKPEPEVKSTKIKVR